MLNNSQRLERLKNFADTAQENFHAMFKLMGGDKQVTVTVSEDNFFDPKKPMYRVLVNTSALFIGDYRESLAYLSGMYEAIGVTTYSFPSINLTQAV